MVPRENKNNAYAKFGGQTNSIMVFSEMAYCQFCNDLLLLAYLILKVKINKPSGFSIIFLVFNVSFY